MKFTGTMRSFRIDKQAYKDRLHEWLSNRVTHAAFLWLNAVLSEIPVWSGASHATFLHLARAVGYQLAVQPRVISRQSYGQSHGDGEVEADPVKGQYTFRYSTTLPHLIYNEEFNANATPDATLFYRLIKPGPYRFQQRGVKAFEEYAKTVRLPNPFNSLKIKNHVV